MKLQQSRGSEGLRLKTWSWHSKKWTVHKRGEEEEIRGGVGGDEC